MDRQWKSVADVLGSRRGTVFSVAPDTSVHAALELLAAQDIGVVVVVDAGKPVGIFSERDLARKVVLTGRSARDTPVSAVMSPQVLYVTPKHTILECMVLMQQDRVRHLVVMDGSKVVGVISARDILEEVITQERQHIKSLEIDRLVMTTYTGSY